MIGFEADFGGTGFSNSTNIAPFLQINSGAGFYADVTGRLGYAAGPALFYVKGGWAYSGNGPSIWDTGYYPACATTTCSLTNSSFSGWTAGGGIEYKFAAAWSAKIEYRYFDFGNLNGNLYSSAADPSRFERSLTMNAVTVGFNFYVGNINSPLK